MSIWGCSLPATFCQPAAAAGFIYCRSQEWALHSPSSTGSVYLEFSWTHAPFVSSSIQPYPPVAIAVLFYLEFAWGGGLPPLQWSLPHDSSCSKLSLLLGCWAGAATPAFSGQLVYLQFPWRCAPLPLCKAQGTRPLCNVSFLFSCLFIIQFFFFFPGRGSVYPGGYADLSQGVPHTTYLLTWWSPKQFRSWWLVVWEPSWFLHLMWLGDVMSRLRVWRCQSFASSWWFFLPGVSPVSLQEFTLGSMLSASSH
jgi:hypothetical protein